jgi:hypothetical protein
MMRIADAASSVAFVRTGDGRSVVETWCSLRRYTSAVGSRSGKVRRPKMHMARAFGMIEVADVVISPDAGRGSDGMFMVFVLVVMDEGG